MKPSHAKITLTIDIATYIEAVQSLEKRIAEVSAYVVTLPKRRHGS